jgi:hypothetical protein
VSDTIQSQGEPWVRLAWYQQQGQELSDAQAELAALREAVRVLGAECALQREFRSRLTEYKMNYLDLKGERVIEMERRLIGKYPTAKQHTDANPLARAAVEGQ